MTIIAYHYGFESERLAEATRASCAGMRSAFKLCGRKRTRTIPPRAWAPAVMCGAHGITRTCPPRLHVEETDSNNSTSRLGPRHHVRGARQNTHVSRSASPPRPWERGSAPRCARRVRRARGSASPPPSGAGHRCALRSGTRKYPPRPRHGVRGSAARTAGGTDSLRPLTGRSDLSRRRALRPLASPPPSYAGRRSRRTQRCRAPRRPKLPSVRAASRRRRGPPNRPVTSQESRTGRGPRLPRRTWPRQDQSLWPGARAYGVRSSSKMQPAESARTPEPAVAGRGKTDRGRRRAGFPAVARPAPARPLRAMRAGGAPGGAPEHCPRSGGR